MTSPGINVDTSVNDGARTPLALSLEAMVSRLDALVAVQTDVRQDLKANLDMIAQFSTNSGAQGAARDAQNSLLDGGNPLAGYTMGSPQTFNPASQGFAAMPQGMMNAGMYGGYPMYQPPQQHEQPDPSQTMAQYQVPISVARAQQAAYMGSQIAGGLPIDLNPYDVPRPGYAPQPGYGQPMPAPGGGSNTPQPAPPPPPAPPAPPGGGGGGGGGQPPNSPVPGGGGGGPQPGPGGPGGPGPSMAQAGAGGAVAGSRGDFGTLMQQFAAIPAAARAIPYVGAAVPFIKYGAMGVQEFMNQRNMGYRWQEIEGGSNLAAQRERFHEGVYRYTTPGFMPGEADQAFEGVSTLGIQRRSEGNTSIGRMEALDFIYRNRTNMGMDVDDSLQFVESAHNTGNTLAGLTDALRELSDAAGMAGVNTRMVRQNMAQSYETAVNAGIHGQGAVQTAFGSASYGMMSTNLSSIDNRGQFTDRNQMYRYAAQAGMSIGEWMAYQRSDPTGAAQVRENNLDRQMSVNISDEQKTWIRNRLSAIEDRNGELTPTDFQQVGRDFEQTFKPDNVYQIIDMLKSQAGMSGVNEANWSEFLARHIGGDTAANRMEEEFGATGQIKDGKYVTGPKAGQAASEEARNPGTGNIEDKGSVDNLLHRNEQGKIDWTQSVLKAPNNVGNVLQDVFNPFGGNMLDDLFGQDSKAADAYKAWQKRHPGMEEPVIENLLSKVDNPNDQMVEVDVDDSGKPRVMTLAQAIKDFHNEVVAGKVRLLDKDGKTKTLTELGVATDSSRDTTLNDSDPKKQKAGMSSEEYGDKLDGKDTLNPFDGRKGLWAKLTGGGDGKDKDEDNKGTVKLDLTPEARRLVQMMGGDDSAASGEPKPAESSVTNR